MPAPTAQPQRARAISAAMSAGDDQIPPPAATTTSGENSTSGRSASDGTSLMWLSPRLIESTTDSTTSTSRTRYPASANVCASGSPT